LGTGASFALLGPLLVQCDEKPVPLASPKQRTLLAALLLRPNQIVSSDELAELIWPDRGEAAQVTLRSYVMRLRRTLGPLGARLETTAPGYRLVVHEAAELDAARFTELCRRGRAAAKGGNWAGAAADLDEALQLWRGEPLVDVASPALAERAGAPLAELRSQARELWCESQIQLGHPQEVVAELHGLIQDEPLRENPYALLMIALDRLDRRAEALEVFRTLRSVLRAELGIEPGARLQDLHQHILAAERKPDGTERKPGTTPANTAQMPQPAATESAAARAGTTDRAVNEPESAAGAVPRILPIGAAFFTGREPEVDRLLDLLDPRREAVRRGAVPPGGTAGLFRPALVAVSGMGGTGKTSLTLHVAHLMRDFFSDGQLYLNLHGTSLRARKPGAAEHGQGPEQEQEQAEPAGVGSEIGQLLRLLGVPTDRLPAAAPDRLALAREHLAGRRILVVLDDARDAAQIRALLPALADSAVIVTCRNQLAGLAGAAHVSVEAMDRDSSRRLLARLIGAPRVEREAQAAELLLELCADLPLALRLAGSRLATRPRWAVADLCESMSSARDRLDQLSFGDESVRAAFEVAYRGLGREELRRLFCLVGLAAGAELGLDAISALARRSGDGLESDLEHLTDACILQSSAPGRYGAHDLLRDYAAERAGTDLPERDRTEALARLLSWYTLAASNVDDALVPKRPRKMITVREVPEDLPPVPQFPGAAEAFAWAEAEQLNLQAAIRLGAAAEDPALLKLAWQLPVALHSFYLHQSNPETMLELLELAAGAVGRLDTPDMEVPVRSTLAIALCGSGRFAQAVEELEWALAANARLAQPRGEVHMRTNMAIALAELGRLTASAEQFDLVLAAHRASGDLTGQAVVWTNVANLRLLSGDVPGSLAACAETGAAAEAARAAGQPTPYWDEFLRTKAECLRAAGQLAQAADVAAQSADLRRAEGNRPGLAVSLRLHGELLTELGHPRADAVLAEAADLERELKKA
jgi:DNA-binding SARP family transcriptional activator/tetratricopeptide (TPR) repeat protein